MIVSRNVQLNHSTLFNMTALSFFGCAFTAYGPALALFLFTIASDPVKIIILILSAFFWLLSLLFSSVLWLIVTQFSVSRQQTSPRKYILSSSISPPKNQREGFI